LVNLRSNTFEQKLHKPSKKSLYDGAQVSIKTNLGNSRFVNIIKKGVKQGD